MLISEAGSTSPPAPTASEPEFISIEPAFIPRSIVGLQTSLLVVLHGFTTSARAGATQARVNIGGFTTNISWSPSNANDRVLSVSLSADDAETVFNNLNAQQDHITITVTFHNAASQAVGNTLRYNLFFGEDSLLLLDERVEELEERNPTALSPIAFNAALAINWSDGKARSVTLTGDTTITFSNVKALDVLVLTVTQDSTGGRGITWPSSVEWAGGNAEGPSSGGGEKDVYTLLALSSTEIVATALLNVS